ncbi:MAG: SelB C-terminal domain-containing protein, partial [Candidatus Eremiobacteraeota bacterium]|nr:SelB C-terminal domain-containing protein [Candidatus Eremiobacteraeota bacterium]
ATMLEALHELPERDPESPAYLPVDRVFAIAGHGTIVTGTLMQGTLAVGDRVKLEPSGKQLRVRALHVFGQARPKVSGGSRVAVNLPGIEVREIERGEMLASPQFTPSDSFTVRFTPLAQAVGLLRRRNPVRAYIGSAEILGTLVLDGPPQPNVPVIAQIFLKRSTIAYPGTAFVLRRQSPKTLLGGGRIESPEPAGNPETVSREEDTRSPRELAVLAALQAAALEPRGADDVARETNLREDAIVPILESLTEAGEIVRVARPTAYVHGANAESLLLRLEEIMRSKQQDEPWAMGMTSVGLSRATGLAEPLTVRMLSAFVHVGRLAHRAGYYFTIDHVPKLNAEQRDFFDRVVPLTPGEALIPAPLEDVLTALKQSRVPGVAKAFDTLVAHGALIKVGDSLYRGTQIAEAHAKVESFLRAEERMTMAQFRDLLGTSRKYAVPFLEWFDSRGITVRSGDFRVLRARKEPT